VFDLLDADFGSTDMLYFPFLLRVFECAKLGIGRDLVIEGYGYRASAIISSLTPGDAGRDVRYFQGQELQ